MNYFKSKSDIAHKLTLMDTSIFRRIGLEVAKKYSKEPGGYRSKLYDFYMTEMTKQQLIQLIKLRKGDE